MRKFSKHNEKIRNGRDLVLEFGVRAELKNTKNKNYYPPPKKTSLILKRDRPIRTEEWIKGNISQLSVWRCIIVTVVIILNRDHRMFLHLFDIKTNLYELVKNQTKTIDKKNKNMSRVK